MFVGVVQLSLSENKEGESKDYYAKILWKHIHAGVVPNNIFISVGCVTLSITFKFGGKDWGWGLI